MDNWRQTFFDADYLGIWSTFTKPERTGEEAAGLWELLGLRTGSRVLDAPCGYGRLSRVLAEMGALVLRILCSLGQRMAAAARVWLSPPAGSRIS